MKKLILFISLFASFNIFADENRYFELTITDTLVLNAISYNYNISYSENKSFFGINFSDDEANTAVKSNDILDIAKILDNNSFQYVIDSLKDYSISKVPAAAEIRLSLKSVSELNKIYFLLKNEEGLNCKITEITYEPISKYYESIYKNLYNKAFNQAKLMAQISGTSIDKFISSTDVLKDGDAYMNIYKQMMKEIPISLFLNSDKDLSRKKEVIKMVFKFSIK